MLVGYVFFFFFKQKTAYELRISDWSSDVCSSDLTMVVVLRHGYGVEASDVIAQRGKKTTRVLVGQHSQNKMDFLSRCKVGMKMLAKRFTSGRIMAAIKPDLSIGNEVSQGA